MSSDITAIQSLKCKEPKKSLFAGLASGLLITFCENLFTPFYDNRFGKSQLTFQRSAHQFQQLAETKGVFRALPKGFFYALALPFIEEFVWRGCVRSMQRQKVHAPENLIDKSKRIALNSLLFTVSHLSFKQSAKVNCRIFFPIFASAIIYNLLTEKTDNIWASFIAHSFNNSFTVLGLLKSPKRH